MAGTTRNHRRCCDPSPTGTIIPKTPSPPPAWLAIVLGATGAMPRRTSVVDLEGVHGAPAVQRGATSSLSARASGGHVWAYQACGQGQGLRNFRVFLPKMGSWPLL